MAKIIAIDPGNIESAFYLPMCEIGEPLFGKMENEVFLTHIKGWMDSGDAMVIEQVACMGMAVGKHVFETVYWSGRFAQTAIDMGLSVERIKRHEVKTCLCANSRAKDSNIITAIVDIYDPDREFGKLGKGTKKKPGPFFGFSKDVWQAFALYLTWESKREGCTDISHPREIPTGPTNDFAKETKTA